MKLIGLLFFQLPTLGDFVPSSTERATISKDCGRLGRGVDPCDHYVVDRRAALLALTLGSLGCSDERYDLAVGPDIATVVVVGVGGEQPRAWAFSASEGAVRLTSTELEDDAVRFRLLVVGYRKTLDELELPSGAQELRPDGDPLPPWDASWKMDSRSAGFSPAREVDPALTELRLRRVQAADRCLAANSCFGIQDEVCQTFCEVEPHVPDAWIDESKRDAKDGGVGIVGYEINFNRYFYIYEPPRALEEIQADIQAIEKDIVRMLAEITGSGA